MKRKLNKVICPCCKGVLNINDCNILGKSYNNLHRKNLFQKTWPKIIFRGACDYCIQQNRALIAKPFIQNYNSEWDLPHLMFWDKTTNCQKCKIEFVFSKEEQQFWYEKLKFIIYSFPKYCLNCRKERRAKISQNNRLMELLNQEYLNDKQLMREIAEIYSKIGNDQKHKFFLRKIEKLNVTDKIM
ncbi:zinc-ribbon domain containing protein [uncultured Polaribacter sp.]|uniref:zinc-ribbon domain containing protein n=1 Tax=uncultured Polaribacter sp. TaxID=174711 RepID=UPI00262A2A88|nr:zinc-ribbon domain containing protein [uncultured Polaribacter sp.]